VGPPALGAVALAVFDEGTLGIQASVNPPPGL
jgi:hypothetical protein